jgi:hypothetical protein
LFPAGQIFDPMLAFIASHALIKTITNSCFHYLRKNVLSLIHKITEVDKSQLFHKPISNRKINFIIIVAYSKTKNEFRLKLTRHECTGGNAGVTISNNRFDDNAGGAIQVGDANTCATVQESNVTITGNMIAAGNAFDYLDNGGIFVACGAGIVITNNEVARTPWGPIAVGWGWSTTPYATDISISGNYINGPCIGPQPLSWDCGGLYMMGGHSSTASYATGLQATGNYLKGAAYIGLYLDQGSAWATLTSNITQDSVNYWLQISPVGAAANHIQVLGTYSDSANVLNSGTNVTISGTSTISSGTQPFGTPQQAIICAAGVPGATACTTPKTWPTWQTGVGATWSKPQIGP